MNDIPEYKLVSLWPTSAQAVVTQSMLIETVYHQKLAYELEFTDTSYLGEPVEKLFTSTYLDELIEHEDDYEPGEQIDFLAWHITPVFAEQFSWLYMNGWTRGINASGVDEWFQADKRYCILVQAVNKFGETMCAKLAWLRKSDDTEAFEQIIDTAHRLEERSAAMFAYTVYEPRLVAAFSLLRPHPAWAAPEFGEDE